MKLVKPAYILFAILLIGATFRLWGLGSAEIFHDEGFYAFRSIGYIDYLQNADQTTPMQWFSKGGLPWWTSLSFHDHPPFFFLFQHLFINILGDTLFVARLPSVIAGLLAIWFIYLIARQVFKNSSLGGEATGLLAAALLTFNHIHIWISRSSLMESTLIALILLNIFLFIKFIENRERYWFWLGLTLGLAFLTKYTAAFLAPTYLVFLLFFKREAFKEKWLYLSAVFSTFIFSPVLVYNYNLYKLVSHFDLQFAYLFKQVTPEWRVSLGKVMDPFSDLFLNLLSMYSIPFILLSLLGIFFLIYKAVVVDKTSGVIADFDNSAKFIWLSLGRLKVEALFLLLFIFITIMLIPLGSAFRFIALYAPILVFFVAIFYLFIKDKYGFSVASLMLAGLIIYELIFSIYGIFITFPDRGIVKLDQYLDESLGVKASAAVPQTSNPNLNIVINEYGRRLERGATSSMLIYDENISLSPKLWLFARRLFYHGLTTTTATNFRNMIQSGGVEYFKDYELYFVRATLYTTLAPTLISNDASELENFLNQEFKLQPEKIIYGHLNLPMFKVYKLSL